MFPIFEASPWRNVANGNFDKEDEASLRTQVKKFIHHQNVNWTDIYFR